MSSVEGTVLSNNKFSRRCYDIALAASGRIGMCVHQEGVIWFSTEVSPTPSAPHMVIIPDRREIAQLNSSSGENVHCWLSSNGELAILAKIMDSSTHFYHVSSFSPCIWMTNNNRNRLTNPATAPRSTVLPNYIVTEMAVSESQGLVFMSQLNGGKILYVCQKIDEIGSTNVQFVLRNIQGTSPKIALAANARVAAISLDDALVLVKFGGLTVNTRLRIRGNFGQFIQLCALSNRGTLVFAKYDRTTIHAWNTSDGRVSYQIASKNGQEITALFVSEVNDIYFVSGGVLTRYQLSSGDNSSL